MQQRMLCLLLAGIMIFTAGFSHGMVPVAEAASGPLFSEASQHTVPQSAEPPRVHSPQLWNVTLGKYSLVIHNTNSVPLEDGSRQYTVEFTGDPGMRVFAFNPPGGDIFGIQGPETDGTHQSFTFTLTQEQLQAAAEITVNFFFSDDCRAFLSLS